MKELRVVCDGKNKYNQRHWFGAEGESEYFKRLKKCIICQRPLILIEVEIGKGRGKSGLVTSEAWGFLRGQEIDKLKRMPWWNEIVALNNPDQKKSNDVWDLKEAEKLFNLYKMYGNATAALWDVLAANIGRSLAAVERQLRIIRDFNKDELRRFYPDL
jgi:RNAse (barnase) inhibitor barstar